MSVSHVGLRMDYASADGVGEDPLLERLRNGEPAAVGEVYDQHYDAVRAFAGRLLGDPVAAEDLVHDTFIALPGAMRRFRGGCALRTFLLSIAVNHARHHVRGAARRRAAHHRLQRQPSQEPADPEQNARRAELARLLTRALDRLPLDQRVAFVLCEVEERTSREAGEIAGVPEVTVRTRLHHAKRKLRAALEKEGVR